MEMKDFVIGIGRTNIDLIYSGLDRLPALGEEVYSKGFEIHLGGGIPGESVILSKLGIPTKAVTWLGDGVFSGRYGIMAARPSSKRRVSAPLRAVDHSAVSGRSRSA